MSKLLSSNNVQKLIHNVRSKHFISACNSNQNVIVTTKFQSYKFNATGWDSLQKRLYSEKKDVAVPKYRTDTDVSTDVKTTIKETTKTISYTGVILLGVGVTAALFFAVFRELFSGNSPSGIYSRTFKICSEDSRVQDALGTPIKGHGEETSRGRRRHVSHVKYEKDGVPHIRMVFYLKGSRQNATVHLDMRENSSGDFEYRYLFIQLDDYLRRVIVLQDNRAAEDASKSFKTPLDEFTSLSPQ